MSVDKACSPADRQAILGTFGSDPGQRAIASDHSVTNSP
jgi:hypothetical protein